MKKYEVTINEVKGICENDLFKSMLKNGDVQADKLKEKVNTIQRIKGYAICHVETETKTFDINYYATDEGYISSGSEVFLKSVKAYMGLVESFKIAEVKTNKGTTYKAVPILVDNSDVNSEE